MHAPTPGQFDGGPSNSAEFNVQTLSFGSFLDAPRLPSLASTNFEIGLARGSPRFPVRWGAEDALERGPVIVSPIAGLDRNVAGSSRHGAYYALAEAAGRLSPEHRPDYSRVVPAFEFPQNPRWKDIITFDPFGLNSVKHFAHLIERGVDIRNTLASSFGTIAPAEILESMRIGRLRPDGQVLAADGGIKVLKVVIDPIWYLPGLAQKIHVEESALRSSLAKYCRDPEVENPSTTLFQPAAGEVEVYIIGDPARLSDPSAPVAVRLHDACSGSDIFNYDICTCRPYLIHGIEVAIETAQMGGVGIIVYFPREGRGLGQIPKYDVYSARKNNPNGDRHEEYFSTTASIAGTADARFQQLSPDVLHWLGVTKIAHWASESPEKLWHVQQAGIEVLGRKNLPQEYIPENAHIEMAAKRAAGYGVVSKPSCACGDHALPFH